ncbi:uncharacterized protein LOC119327828 [Triticum dicoccoides]|uniref:uncharacterized protein LOC119327828 n=1 Tax=Triticum dicoccoides TaxID=85692 RepID=UPI001890E99F|nr:uncharacterized protein LOC119327828 [Triticum dicoccoides]XP_037456808.1 uncharacterized protein LOC119327828 [Triticum dicoccoides]
MERVAQRDASSILRVLAKMRQREERRGDQSTSPRRSGYQRQPVRRRGNAPSWGGGGHQSNPQAQVHHTIIAPSLQTSTMGLNAPSLSGGVRSLIMQGHHTHIASTPENNTTTDAPTVGPENRAIHVPGENPRGES